MKGGRIGWLVAAALLLPGGVAAQARRPAAPEPEGKLPEPIQEFFLAETVYPQDRGELQLTLGVGHRDETAATLLAEYGITDRFQLSLETPPVHTGALDEPGQLVLGALYNLMNTRTLAVSAQLEAGISDTDAEGRRVEWEPALVAGVARGPLQVHAVAALSFARDEDTEFSPGVGALYDAGRWTPTLELTGSASKGEASSFALTPGVYYHFAPGIEAGVAAPIELRGSGFPRLVAKFTMER